MHKQKCRYFCLRKSSVWFQCHFVTIFIQFTFVKLCQYFSEKIKCLISLRFLLLYLYSCFIMMMTFIIIVIMSSFYSCPWFAMTTVWNNVASINIQYFSLCNVMLYAILSFNNWYHYAFFLQSWIIEIATAGSQLHPSQNDSISELLWQELSRLLVMPLLFESN